MHVKSLALAGVTRAGVPKATQWSGLTAEDRFWRYVQKTETCWMWLGAVNVAGYGLFNNGGAYPSRLAHRYSYFLAKGELNGQLIRHLCHTPACVNPAHLQTGDMAANHRDSSAEGRYGGGKDLDLLQLFYLARYGFCNAEISRLLNKPENSIRYILLEKRRPHLKRQFEAAMLAWEEAQ